MEFKLAEYSPLKVNNSTYASSKYNSQFFDKDSYNKASYNKGSTIRAEDLTNHDTKYESYQEREQKFYDEDLDGKVNEAKSILNKAKETLRKMKAETVVLDRERLEILQKETFSKYSNVTVLATEMRMNVRRLEQEVRELRGLTSELLIPGYYRRNDYPHGWRLSRNFLTYN